MKVKSYKRVLKVKAGLMSSLNYLNGGYRIGFWKLAAEKFIEERVAFVVLVGGLVCRWSLEKIIKEGISTAHEDETNSETDEEVISRILTGVAISLSSHIPVMPGIKLYIVPSPAYDGPYGQDIAEKLAEIRHQDILVYRSGGDRLRLKKLDIVLGAYPPVKTSWRSDYYDTPVKRVLNDQKKRSTRGIGDIGIVGCFGSTVFHPGDSTELQKPYLSVPALYHIQETRTSENQVGVRIISIYEDRNLKRGRVSAKQSTITTYNFKDMLSSEWESVRSPPGSSVLMEKLVRHIGTQGPATLGQLSSHVGTARKKIAVAMDDLLERRASKYWPGLILDDVSKRYFFRENFFRENFIYEGDISSAVKEKFAAFACLHAGCRHTDMGYFCDKMPHMILEHDVRYLCGVGDFPEGFAHRLLTSGENYGSRELPANTYDYQESLAAFMVGTVIGKVFDVRIQPFLAEVEQSKKTLTRNDVFKAISDALITFLYIPGNHCEWTEYRGFTALSVFSLRLERFVVGHVEKIFREAGISTAGVFDELIPNKLVRLEENQAYTLPSGLKIALIHPKMGRSKTTSIRLQSALELAKECQIVLSANFHVAEALEEWQKDLGQRLCVQIGTFKVDSDFERGKMKIVDFGPAFFEVASKDKRIQRTEVTFYAEKSTTYEIQERNLEILNMFEVYMRQHKHVLKHWWKDANDK